MVKPKRCNVISVGKRRDGGTRYWCLEHRADATAKYGVPAEKCRYAGIVPPTESEILDLDIARYPGGVALWGAVPPVYDTTREPLDRGVHVHARIEHGSTKEIDGTYRGVRLADSRHHSKRAEISEIDAIYYMVSSIFGFPMLEVLCGHCGYSHLDKDWFCLHEHKRHLCAGCGKYFTDTKIGIGNPIIGIQKLFATPLKPTQPAKNVLEIQQDDYPGGLQIWGSNASIFWTGQQPEEEGIHVHAFREHDAEMFHDDTFSKVVIDGVVLDSVMVRILMAQRALPHISNRVVSLVCPECNKDHFSSDATAFTPRNSFVCSACGAKFPSKGRLHNVISNPMIRVFSELSRNAPRKPQVHSLDLLPETL